MKKLSENDHIDFYRHLAFCAVGGFFGCYAVLVHSGVMGNAQTMNLLELVIDLLRWQLPDMLLHLGALALYVLGTMLTVLLPTGGAWICTAPPPSSRRPWRLCCSSCRRSWTRWWRCTPSSSP